jgi:hypothetical protein
MRHLDRHQLYFAPKPALADLRKICLARSETRCPIWRFRIRHDLVVSLQPRPAIFPNEVRARSGIKAQIVRFACVAVAVENGDAVATMLTASPYDDVFHKRLWARREFEVIQTAGDICWHLDFRGCSHARRTPLEDVWALDKRLTRVFRGKFFDGLTPETMLGENCLICGAPLSDPISMGRKVGPECFGSSSNVMPITIVKRRRRS